MTRTLPHLTVLVLLPFLLASCKGGADDTGSGTGGSSGTTLPITDSSTLLASFIETLDPIRSQANRLLTRNARYTLQTAPSGMYVDKNRNNRFDTGVDVRLVGNPIEHAGIHYAHAAGLTGDGEVIAFSDSGFLTSHDAFSGRSITTGTGLGVADHGTFVASVAAGNSSDMIGVAPEADLIFGSFDSFAQLTETANAAAAANAVALNNSWGFSNRGARTSDYVGLFSSSAGADYLTALRNFAEDGIVVFSVPNTSSLSVTGLMPALPMFDPSLEQSWIAVVNGVPVMSGDDVVSAERVSEPCLEAAAWCISANGSWTGANADSSSSYGFGTGTSYAAPSVSGALALLGEAFPNMTNQELRIRLLASADNDFDGFTQSGTTELVSGFEHAYSDEWGHGFLDVAAALLPIGRATVTTGDGTVLDAQRPLVTAGNATGDAVARALQNVQIDTRDALSASFSVNASQMVAQRSAAPLFSIHDLANFGRPQTADLGSAAFFGDRQGLPVMLSDDDVELSLFHGQNGGSDALGFGLSRRFDLGDASLRIGTAYGEDTAALMSNWSGGTNSSIASFDMALSTALSEASALTISLGYAYGQEASGLVQSADVRMNASAVSYAHNHLFKHNDRLKLSLALPAAVSSGETSLSLPVTSSSGATTHEDVRIGLAPNSREVRLSVTYEHPVTRNTTLGLSFAHAENRGHIAGNRDTGVMFGLQTRF
ncbi:S8 family peptidase [Shimia sp.]|uniref:S8 family peptidase n=1 Tax=Shimia sp. TaxID=1954381 RepID=UPI003B8C6713